MYIVEVIESATGDSVKTFWVDSKRKAEKLEDGLWINLNHEHYHTNIRES